MKKKLFYLLSFVLLLILSVLFYEHYYRNYTITEVKDLCAGDYKCECYAQGIYEAENQKELNAFARDMKKWKFDESKAEEKTSKRGGAWDVAFIKVGYSSCLSRHQLNTLLTIKDNNLNTESSGSSSYSNPLQVIEDGWCYGGFGTKSVCGVIVNNSNEQKDYVQVEINLYDSQGFQTGATMANLLNLEPNGKWNFKAIVLENEAVSYKIKKITSF